MNKWTDADPDELEFAEDLKTSLRDLGAGACPPPELIQGTQTGVLPEEVGIRVAEHLKTCPLCRTLARDLDEPEFSQPTPEEKEGIWERIADTAKKGTGAAKSSRILCWLRPVPVVAVLLLAATTVLLWTQRRRESPPEQIVASQPKQLSPGLSLEKPPVRLDAASLLIWRGKGDKAREQYLTELGSALAPYRADDFAEAARRLEEFVRKYPDSYEARFYFGISCLFLGRNPEAVEALLKVRDRAPLADEAGWYLSVAYDRMGRSDLAAAELRRLCDQSGEYQARACGALRSMESQRR